MYKFSFIRHSVATFSSHFKESLQAQNTKVARGRANTPMSEPLSSGAAFDDIKFKPFPVRAAFDVNNGQVTMAVARVDARQRAIKDFMFQSQLPFHVEYETGFAQDGSPLRTLTQKSVTDLQTKVRMLMVSMNREGPGVTEVAGLLAWPFYELTDGGREIAKTLSASLKIDFRVVGQHKEMLKDPRQERLAALRRKRSSKEDPASQDADGTEKSLVPSAQSPEDEMGQLAFMSFAAAAKVVDRSRMVAIVEHPATLRSPDGAITSQFCGGKIELVGTIDEPQSAPRNASSPEDSQSSPLQRFQLPVSTLDAHAMLLRDIQRRDEGLLHVFSSPNPVHRREAIELRNGLLRMLSPQIPQWVTNKIVDGGGVLVGASENGGLINIAARLAEHSNIGLEKLEQAVDYSMCGLTDVLIGHNMPNPQLIVPQGVLASSIMAACGTHRMEYLPRVSVAQAILIHPDYWSYSRRKSIEDSLSRQRWYQSGAQRTFVRPHAMRKDNPNEAVVSNFKVTPIVMRY